MAAATSNDELSRISEGLFTIVKMEIGQEDEVRIRRQTHDISTMFESSGIDHTWKSVVSGSKAEGFAFMSSDLDIMSINKNVLVIDIGQRNIFNTAFYSMVLLMENNNSSPGFTLLKCISYDSRIRDDNIEIPLLQRGGSVYMSSERAQQITLTKGQTSVHGPCRSGTSHGIEYDCAYTLKCPFWPIQAHSFINRSIRNGWPISEELIDLCKDGCLLVPISSKQRSLSDHTDLEWRISFSLAEKKLVFSMNHCQFLCYGLMKIFLNEVLKELPETKTETGNVLCSYFMKTAVFWELSGCVNDWSNRSFLDKFLNVFRRVIKWVEEGYCPNFFIPEYNMFYGKIYGRRQRELVVRLRSLYDDGIMCLYRCTSLRGELSMMLNDRFKFDLVQMLAADYLAFPKEKVVVPMLIVAQSMPISPHCDISAIKKALCYTASLVPDSDEMLLAIKLRINFILHMLAIKLATHSSQNLTSNKLQYLLTKTAKSILRETKTSYCMDTIYQAVISYINGEYNKTIQIIEHIHHRLQSQIYTYQWKIDLAIIIGSRQQEMSYEDIVKAFIIDNYYYNPVISIPELTLESIVLMQNSPIYIFMIPPLVFLYFLQILSYTRLNKPVERKEALDELHSILYNDNNHHVPFKMKPISWEILGICQQLYGNYVGAYQSYLNALNDKYNEFKEATIFRIKSLFFK